MQQYHRLGREKAIIRKQQLHQLQVDYTLEQQHKALEERCPRLEQERPQQKDAKTQ